MQPFREKKCAFETIAHITHGFLYHFTRQKTEPTAIHTVGSDNYQISILLKCGISAVLYDNSLRILGNCTVSAPCHAVTGKTII